MVSGKGITAIASGLGLALAKYRPTPQVATDSSNSTSTANSFKSDTAAALNASIWGIPSTLVLPNTSTANSFVSTATVGPGSCPLNTTAYVPTAKLPSPTYTKFNSVKANIMRYREQVSVNLGGWFLQEGWMQTEFMECAIYAGASEFSIVSGFGTSANGLKSARNYMEKHWDTWITEDDFAYLASRGVNTVRLPIGYWSVGPYFAANSSFANYADVYENSWKYVGRAINWAAKYDIGVLLDLHGAYGSQNGLDHSGKVGAVNFFTAANKARTTSLLTWLSWELSDVTNIIGIELLNEPSQYDGLWQWYNTTADAMRESSTYAKSLPLYIQDAYNLNAGVALVATRSDFTVVDNHSYFVFTNADKALSADAHIANIEGSYLKTLAAARTKARGNLIIGEWSCSLDWGSVSSYSDPDAKVAEYCRAEFDTYANATGGSHFWSYKMEGCNDNAGWCFTGSIAKGYLPKYFNSWGLTGLVTNTKLLSNSATAIKIGSKIKTTIAGLTVPGTNDSAASTAPASLVSTFTKRSAESVERAADLAGIGGAPLLEIEDLGPKGAYQDKRSLPATEVNVAREISAVAINEEEEGPIARAHHRRGHGSIAGHAARHAQLERRALSAAGLAKQSGFSDGYLTATYFAASFADTTPLSRLGFRTQYVIDSWAKRVAAQPTKYLSSNFGHYRTNFKKGQLEAEADILKIINAA